MSNGPVCRSCDIRSKLIGFIILTILIYAFYAACVLGCRLTVWLGTHASLNPIGWFR